MRIAAMAAVLLLAAVPAWGQGVSIPGLGGSGGGTVDALRGAFGEQTPEQKRAFCGRVGQAALACGTREMGALSACLVKTLPPQDSARVARVANASRGSAGGIMQECGLTLGR
jgi:hypothetical protein